MQCEKDMQLELGFLLDPRWLCCQLALQMAQILRW